MIVDETVSGSGFDSNSECGCGRHDSFRRTSGDSSGSTWRARWAEVARRRVGKGISRVL